MTRLPTPTGIDRCPTETSCRSRPLHRGHSRMAAQQRFHAGISDSLRGTLDCLSGRRICCLEKQGLDAKSPQLLVTARSCGLYSLTRVSTRSKRHTAAPLTFTLKQNPPDPPLVLQRNSTALDQSPGRGSWSNRRNPVWSKNSCGVTVAAFSTDHPAVPDDERPLRHDACAHRQGRTIECPCLGDSFLRGNARHSVSARAESTMTFGALESSEESKPGS